MSNDSPSAAAIHEAGHAVACLLLGGRVPTITIEKDGTGLTTTCLPDRDFTPLSIVAIAGPVAESRHVGCDYWDCISEGDMDNLLRYGQEAGFEGECDYDELIGSLAKLANTLLTLRPHTWRAVETLAKRLDVERTIEGVTISNLAVPCAPHHVLKSGGFERLQKAAAVLWGEGGEYP